ncbi:MAG: SGNH/GDSL hydrolase family protein [Clostridia bacterium]|nr:SGNH/GDSL hydrolase family protein [Clostridia bacterium]
MKRWLLWLITLSLVGSITACGGVSSTNSSQDGSGIESTDSSSIMDSVEEEEALRDYDSYNLNTYLVPYWDTKIMYNETVMFVGADDEAPLLYTPTEIVSVRNYGLNIEYMEGVDYVVENGKIKRTANSAIPYFEVDQYYLSAPDSVAIKVVNDKADTPLTGTKYLKYDEYDVFTSKQIAITYRHAGTWQGTKPQGKSARLQNVLTKLKNAEDVNVVYYGDSITTGCNASGTSAGGNVAPYTPGFFTMVNEYLENKYGSFIFCANTAVAGWNTSQGLEAVQARVLDKNPDLLVLAFGMNDMNTPVDSYKTMIKGIMDRLFEQNPNANVILVGTTVSNYESDWYGNQELFIEALNELESEYNNVAVADMTTMHKDMFAQGKRFRDVTGNNINHPNDFVVRAYAQVILKTLLGDEFTI